jgi:hypothetical protein
MSTDAYPLCWPHGQKRTPSGERERGRFKATPARARDFLLDELDRLGAVGAVLSTNVPLRRDGKPYSDGDPDDPGVAIYFQLKGRPHTMTCDRWDSVSANMQALALTIESMRGIARWGSMEARDQAFAGFAQLPPPAPPAPESNWRRVFNVKPGENISLSTLKTIYHGRVLRSHPDRSGGDHDEMVILNQAMQEAERELGGA